MQRGGVLLIPWYAQEEIRLESAATVLLVSVKERRWQQKKNFMYRSLLASRIFWTVCGRLCSEGPRRLQTFLKVLIGKAASEALPLPTLFEAIHQFTISTIADLHSRWWLLELSRCFWTVLRHRRVLVHLVVGVGDLLDHPERVGLRWIVTPALLAIKRPKSNVSSSPNCNANNKPCAWCPWGCGRVAALVRFDFNGDDPHAWLLWWWWLSWRYVNFRLLLLLWCTSRMLEHLRLRYPNHITTTW